MCLIKTNMCVTGVRCAGVRLRIVLVEAGADCDSSGSESEKSSSSGDIHSAKICC